MNAATPQTRRITRQQAIEALLAGQSIILHPGMAGQYGTRRVQLTAEGVTAEAIEAEIFASYKYAFGRIGFARELA